MKLFNMLHTVFSLLCVGEHDELDEFEALDSVNSLFGPPTAPLEAVAEAPEAAEVGVDDLVDSTR